MLYPYSEIILYKALLLNSSFYYVVLYSLIFILALAFISSRIRKIKEKEDKIFYDKIYNSI
ncbi:hypothetical protein BTO18_04280 [Polaribacter porphyrae]|uniref:Uncharacterized protein n=1 Tax=Polaribacter porphyrae TaxID=1137780 RepID=A0A2S7WLG5_9FLAO|nr:hypothetical protein BTO18_04280 [Polaribacter porphyrae]